MPPNLPSRFGYIIRGNLVERSTDTSLCRPVFPQLHIFDPQTSANYQSQEGPEKVLFGEACPPAPYNQKPILERAEVFGR